MRKRNSALLAAGASLGVTALLAGLLTVSPAQAEETPAAPTTSDSEVTSTPEPAKTATAPTVVRAAGEASVSLTVSQQTGTEPFQADDSAGNDSGADNDIVRTNDTVTYNLGIRYEGEDQTAPTVRFTLPRGQELVSLPPFCLADASSVTPAALPDPEVPLTATSWESLPQQEVTCVLKDESAGTSLDYPFLTKVRSEVPNGTVMDPVVFDVTSDQVTEPVVSDPLTQTVSSAARYDLSKRGFATQANQGPHSQGTGPCLATDPSKTCRYMWYSAIVSVPSGGKGSMPLSSPIEFTDNLDPASFYGAAVWAQMVAEAGSDAAARAAYAPTFARCNPVVNGSGFRGSLPYGGTEVGSYANTTNAVRDSGTLTCPPQAPGDNGQMTLTDADTSAATVPTTTGTGAALPADSGFVVSIEFTVEVPMDAVLEFGDNGDGTYTLDTHNEFTDIKMTGIDGSENTGENPDNNSRDASIRLQTGSGFDKMFSGIYGQHGNTSTSDFTGGGYIFQGSPGSGVAKDGNTVVMPGQAVQSNLRVNANGPAGSGNAASQSFVTCDVWDSSRLALAAHPNWHGYDAGMYPSNGEPVYAVEYREGTTNTPSSKIGTASAAVQNLVIEYSSGPAGPGADSDCSSGTWSTDPADVAGASVSTDNEGRTIWNGVNRVRVSFNTQWPAGATFDGVSLSMAIGQVVLDSADTSPIGNWGSQMLSDGVHAAAEVIADADRTDRVPTYDPETHKGTLGDRLIQGEATARVKKYVENPTTGEFEDSAVPQYTSGATVRYRLNPSLSTSVPVAGSNAEFIIEDCLPKFQVFQASEQGGTAITPELVQMGAPAGSELSCAADRQYVRWGLGSVAIGEPIEPIVVTAEILDVARNGVYTNEVLVSSPADDSAAALRTDDVQMQLVVPTGIKISKTVNKPEIEVNPEGVTKPRTMLWSVYFANIDAPANVANVDVIDALPATGQHGSAFSGELSFDTASVAAGTNITILYTKSASTALSSDPEDASNAAAGATVWCDAVSGAVVSGSGTAADCPQTAAEVTGLRFQRPDAFTPDDEFQIDIAMTPVGNVSGDVYRNITSGRVDGVSQGVGPAARTVTVVASSVGDRVWEDTNKNGLQDDGEPGIAGFSVRLTGTDVDGNAVDRTTVTDADGNYRFDEVVSGTYRVTFDPNGLNSNTTFTTDHTGGDPALDSDADAATGQTQEFTLGVDSDDLTLDAGLVIDRNVAIVLDKKFLAATELDEKNGSTVTYELNVTNNGTAEGTYELNDTLMYGGSIHVDDVRVENTAGDVATDPNYDGADHTTIAQQVALPAGATHTYLVTVDTTVATTIDIAETECVVTTNEQGGGFLNQASLTVDGVTTVVDTGCGEVPVPPTTPTEPTITDAAQPVLPIVGAVPPAMLSLTGAAVGFGVWAALGAVLTGAGLLVLRRRAVRVSR
ncbi:SdrD B-like domain-containing protein [Leucobacter sp. NPDC058333]|uniref:SdrD B-like domain-containing protein n=1 Tax=Leucobacter sp. NPDC058333 TaxID=3346450 RepID=UPI0036661A33